MKKQMLMEGELIERIESKDRSLSDRVDLLERTLADTAVAPGGNASITNLIDNSDYNWSDDAFRNAGITPGTAGDANNRAYNWYRIERSTALLVADDAHSLKGSGHSSFGGETTDTPRWSKTDGWAELGEAGATPWDICCPLPNNFVTPGMRFYLQMLARLRTATALPGELKFFFSLYDNTNAGPLPDVIKGSTFDLSASVVGTPGATTRAYKLIVETDNGDQVESSMETVTTAAASLSPSNYIALSWPRYPGFTNVKIYVTVGGNSFLVGIVGNGAGAFNDVGQTLSAVVAVPSVTGTEPRAYAETRPGVFAPSLDWAEYEFAIAVPSTYNFSLTTGRQWLRGGVIGLMGDGHQLQIDRIGVSTGNGKWSISEGDRNAASLPSTSQTSSTQGPPEGGGGSPPDGEGGPRCSTLDTLIQVCNAEGTEDYDVRLDKIEKGDWLRGKNNEPNRVTRVKRGFSQVIITVQTANGAGRRCSPSDLWLVKGGPVSGTPARRLREGMEVETRVDGCIQYSVIVIHSAGDGEEVRILCTAGNDDNGHIYYAGGAACHNVKDVFGAE